MTYEQKNLSVLAYANGFTLWHYVTDDPESIVSNGGYFNKSADQIRQGDMIIVNFEQRDDAPASAGIYLVTLSGKTWVTIRNLVKNEG